jgi:hypothetical protein
MLPAGAPPKLTFAGPHGTFGTSTIGLDGSPSTGPEKGGNVLGPEPPAPVPDVPEPASVDMPDMPEPPPDIPAFIGVAIVPDVGIAMVPAVLPGGMPVPELPVAGEFDPPLSPGGAFGPPLSIVVSAQPTNPSAAATHAAPIQFPVRPMPPPPPARAPS